MHSLFEHLSVFTWMDVLESNEKCISFLEDLELIPKKTDPTPECPKCSGPMSVMLKKSYALGWQWACKKRKAKEAPCYASINSLRGTFFEGMHVPFMDVLGVMFGYLVKMCFTDIREHLSCWRRRRNDSRQINYKIVKDFCGRFDQIILFALSQEGKTLKNIEIIDREKLLKKYAKGKNIQPTFRNILFQFLMDLKCRYPCIKICKNEDISASVNEIFSTNRNNVVVNETSNKAASTTIVPPCSIPVSSNGLIGNTIVCKDSSLSDCPNTFIAAEDYFNKNINNAEIANVVKLNTPVSTESFTPNITVLNDNTTCKSSSAAMSSDDITFHDDINMHMENVESVNNVVTSINVQTLNYAACKSPKLSNSPRTSIAEELIFDEKENNLEAANIVNFCTSAFDTSFTDNYTLLNENNDGLFMEIDHTETIITIGDDQHTDRDSL